MTSVISSLHLSRRWLRAYYEGPQTSRARESRATLLKGLSVPHLCEDFSLSFSCDDSGPQDVTKIASESTKQAALSSLC